MRSRQCLLLVASLFWVVGGGSCASDEGRPNDGRSGDQSVTRAVTSSDVRTPRLIAPLSTTHTPNQQPTFVWALARGSDGARVDICRDRACANVVQTFDVTGTSGRPPAVVPDGPVFWRATALRAGRPTSAPSGAWEFWGTAMNFPQPGLAGPPADTTWGSVLDVDADGFADLAVGAPGAATGLVHIYLGGASGPAATPSQSVAGPSFFGATLASAGDVNGDGFADLAVATSSGAGSVRVFYGGPRGLGPRSTVLERGPVTASFGATISTAGDVDGDGYADLLVGGREVAQIYRGGPRGIACAASFALKGNDATDATAVPDATVVTGGGDVNGDRIPDAVVSGRSYLGTGSGFTLQADVFQDGKYAGDVNGDGLTDYADGAIILGTPQGLDPNPFRAIAGEAFFTGAGDANHDGFSEAIAAVSSLLGSPDRWRVHYGSPLGCHSNDCGLPQNGLALPGAQPPRSGWAAAGDLNGDHLDDVAVGVAADGAVYLFMATLDGLPGTPTRALTGPGDQFGAAVE
jgi:hypothetical protein